MRIYRSVLCVVFVLLLAATFVPLVNAQEVGGWPQFRGPRVDGISSELGVFPELSGFDLEVVWQAPIGDGFSGVAVVDDLAVTTALIDAAAWVVAFDAVTGDEYWRYELGEPFISPTSSSGPLSTPLIAGNAVIALDRFGRLVSLDSGSGDLLWSRDMMTDFDSRRAPQGYATSPILIDGTVVIQTGAETGSVVGLDPDTGQQRWSAGTDDVFYQTPVPVQQDGRTQVLVAGQTQLIGIDSETGDQLWEYSHNGSDFTGAQSLVPVSAGAGRVFLANKHHSSALMSLTTDAGSVFGEEEWENRSIRNSYTVPVYHEGYVYGFSSRFLTCVDANTGEAVWKSRPPGDGFFILVDGHLVILTKDGSLHVSKASPDGYEELASVEVFNDAVWASPSFANGSIYARSHGEISRIDIRSFTTEMNVENTTSGDADERSTEGSFSEFLLMVRDADDKAAVVDQFLESIPGFPLIEGETLVHFLYRGEGEDLAIAGDLIGARTEAFMTQVEGTDLFYYSMEVESDVRANYHFIRDYEEIVDPRNPRSTTTMMYGPEMEPIFIVEPMDISWFSMPQWSVPSYLVDPLGQPTESRLSSHEIESAVLSQTVTVHTYVPDSYRDTNQQYPVAYFHDGDSAITRGEVPATLDVLVNATIQPLIAVFIETPQAANPIAYAQMWAEDVVPYIDRNFRTITDREGRANIGGGWAAFPTIYTSFAYPDIVGNVAVQSMAQIVFPAPKNLLMQTVQNAANPQMNIYLDWGRYDARSESEEWNLADTNLEFTEFLISQGYTVLGGEVPDGTGWSSWKNRTGRLLTEFFPPN